MMKATIKTRSNVTVEVQAETQAELFKGLAGATECFGEKICGLCGDTDIIFAWRTVTSGKKTFNFPEYHCVQPSCRARLAFGLSQEGGGVFPIRKLTTEGQPSREKGSFGEHNGWSKFKGNVEKE